MAQDMMKDAKTAVNNGAAAIKSKMDVSPIREDLETLREDVRVLGADAKVLGRDLKAEGRKQMELAEEKARDAYDNARERGRDSLSDALAFVQNNPGQSVAIAFVGGMIASLLLGRRG